MRCAHDPNIQIPESLIRAVATRKMTASYFSELGSEVFFGER